MRIENLYVKEGGGNGEQISVQPVGGSNNVRCSEGRFTKHINKYFGIRNPEICWRIE